MPDNLIYAVVIAVICTLLGVALLCAVFLATLRAIKFSKEMLGIIRAIALMAPAVNKIAMELTMLRSIFAASGQQPLADGSEPAGIAQPYAPSARAPFPTAPPNFYPAARVEEPDAKMEDTVIEEGDDAAFKEQEEIEAVRTRGFEAE